VIAGRRFNLLGWLARRPAGGLRQAVEYRKLVTASRGSAAADRHGALRPGTRTVRVRTLAGWPRLVVECGGCGLLATTATAARFHITGSGVCLDPAKQLGPRGGFVMLPDALTVTGRVVWRAGRGRPWPPGTTLAGFLAGWADDERHMAAELIGG
jgi:hypothetical protein